MSIIIVGAGLAAYQLAREFRRLDTTSELLIITMDEGRFYSKPLLSTALTSKKDFNTLTTATASEMAAQLSATILTETQVTQIDTAQKQICCYEKVFHYEKLVLACGADVIKAPLQGDAVNDVLSINHLYHYSAFQNLLQNKKNITILGAGLIGCEFANDLCNAGYSVQVIAPAEAPLDLLIPHSVGKLLETALNNHGVTWHLRCIAESINKKANQYQLLLSNGKTIETDLVLSAIGLRPHTQLAASAGIATNRGIQVDRYLQTSVPDVYALGDCAEVEGHVLPYITPLLSSARALAKTLSGAMTAVDYPAMPVMVKTPIHPLAICPPPRGLAGEWQIEKNASNVKALFYDEAQQLRGFVLTNDFVKERIALAKTLPPLF